MKDKPEWWCWGDRRVLVNGSFVYDGCDWDGCELTSAFVQSIEGEEFSVLIDNHIVKVPSNKLLFCQEDLFSSGAY